MNLIALFQAQVQARPTAAAIIEPQRGRSHITTFAELDVKSGGAAAQFRQGGLVAGDVVLIFLPMSAELYAVVLGLLRLGMTAMFLDPTANAKELEASCSLLSPKGFVASAKAHALRLTCPALRKIPVKFSVGWPVPGAISWSKTAPPFPEVQPCPGTTPALVTFTTGTTGEPKTVVRTHDFLRAQNRVLTRALALQPSEVDLTTLPIFLLANLANGLTSVLPDCDLRAPYRLDPEPVLEQIRRLSVTRCAATPAFFQRLLDTADRSALTSLRQIFVGGAPVFPRLLKALALAMPQGTVHAVYGSTEAEPITHLDARDISVDDHAAIAQGRGLLAGVPVEEIDLRILPEQWGRPMGPLTMAEFNRQVLPPDQPGEILVSGPHVLSGYLHGRGDQETKVRVEDKVWHRTGDAGSLDERGRLWLLGRCSARIQDAIGTLWPLAMESAAMEHPKVRRAALIAHRGRRLLAVEATPDGLLEGDLKSSLAWARLNECRRIEQIPLDRRHDAKIDYRALRSLLE